MNEQPAMRARRLAMFLTLGAAAAAASAQTFPVKPIRIVTTGVGGGNDIGARLIAQGLTAMGSAQLIVDNRGGGTAPGQVVAQAPADGYTLLFAGTSFWTLPLMQKVPYDPLRDFAPITLAVGAPNVLVVHPALPVKSVRELIALAKARPGELNYATAASGGTSHLAGELFKSMAGLNIVRVAYKNDATQMSDLLSGQVQLIFSSPAVVGPHVKTARLKALAVCTEQPSVLMPGVPTVAATGLPGFESAQIIGLFAPARTPEPIVRQLNQEVVRLLGQADTKQKFLSVGVDAIGSSPEAFAARIKSEVERYGKVIREAGITAD